MLPRRAAPPPQALKGEPLTLFGDGKQTRSFQYVSDLIEGGLLGWGCSPERRACKAGSQG